MDPGIFGGGGDSWNLLTDPSIVCLALAIKSFIEFQIIKQDTGSHEKSDFKWNNCVKSKQTNMSLPMTFEPRFPASSRCSCAIRLQNYHSLVTVDALESLDNNDTSDTHHIHELERSEDVGAKVVAFFKNLTE